MSLFSSTRYAIAEDCEIMDDKSARRQVDRNALPILSPTPSLPLSPLACKCPLARDRLIENRAQTEEVRAGIGGFAANLLRRHIRDCPQHNTGAGLRGEGGRICNGKIAFNERELRQTEVEDLDAPIAGEKNVAWL
jgi:hypothetical protein